MCTAIAIHTYSGSVCFGRTMDFSYPLEPELWFVPGQYEWNNLSNTHKIRNRYSYMGIGQNLSPVIFADGVNEAGFAAAALYFPGCAQYDPENDSGRQSVPIAAIELTGFLLGLCASVVEAASVVRTIRIVGVKDSITGSVAPLHWMIADKSGSAMVIEKTREGLRIMDNSIGVLANSPEFLWHMTNLRNYMNVSPDQRKEAGWGPLTLTPFGQGSGTFGLPGDFTSPSRFVRTAYIKSHITHMETDKDAINGCFHILESVSLPKGIVMTERGTTDYTQYTAAVNLIGKEYYFKTYENSRIAKVKLDPGCCDSSEIVSLGKLAALTAS